MSFCSDVKNEICKVGTERNCCKKALLNSAFAFFNTVSDSRIKMTTESGTVAEFLNTLIYELVDQTGSIAFKEVENQKGFTLDVTDSENILKTATKAGLLNKKINQICGQIDDNLSVNPCCQRAAVIGAFLVSGSVTDPNKGYHFEISNHRKETLHKINEILIGMDFFPKIIKRGSDYVLYLKEKEVIADMLNFLNCKETFFDYHDAIILKDKKNQLNRKMNCENANMDKTVNASVDHVMAIRKLKENKTFDHLPDNLKEIAELRIENPEASLTELAKLCKTPITRSGVNHRLKKIMELSLKEN